MVSIRPQSIPAHRIHESVEGWQARANLPTMYDLPSEDPDEPGQPDEYHDLQPQLLSRTLQLVHYARSDCFMASNLNLYYKVDRLRWHQRPDWFLAAGVSRLYEGEDLRWSYVVWQEGKSPDVVIEFLSPGTASEDLGGFYEQSLPMDRGEADSGLVRIEEESSQGSEDTREKLPGKFEVYETYLKVPHYIVYSRYTQRLWYFQWKDGQYEEQSLKPTHPFVWLADLQIGLGIWQGEFDAVRGYWLRWYDQDENWFLTDMEKARLGTEKVPWVSE